MIEDKSASTTPSLQQSPQVFSSQSLQESSAITKRLEDMALQEDVSSDSASQTPKQGTEETKENQEAPTNKVNIIQTKNGPWPTAINPKYLAGTQVGTMIAAQPSNTIIDQLLSDKNMFQDFDMGQLEDEDK